MTRVTGIGGIFFKARDPVALRDWYRKHLGIDVQEWGGAAFPWADGSGRLTTATTLWSVSGSDSDYFAPSTAPFMINCRVADLQALLQGCAVKAATCSRRPTIPNTGSSAGSWTRRATRSSSGSRPKGSESRWLDRHRSEMSGERIRKRRRAEPCCPRGPLHQAARRTCATYCPAEPRPRGLAEARTASPAQRVRAKYAPRWAVSSAGRAADS
jgi:hypothetical protein